VTEYLNSTAETGTYATSGDVITLGNSSPIAGHQLFSADGVNSADYLIKIVNSSGAWKQGICTYNSTAHTLTLSGSWLLTGGTVSDSDAVQVYALGLDADAAAALAFKRYSELLTVVASSGSAQAPVIDGRHYKITLSATCTITLTAPTGAASGVVYSSTIDLVMDGSSTYSWAGGTINEMGTQTDNTTSGAVNSYVVKTYDAGTTWFVYPAGAEV